MAAKPKVIFISYSHDSEEHAERVRGLGASLARDGCDCRLDVHKDTGEDWPAWMTRQLEEADFVLCVITETYERRFRDRELPDVGKGVGWEAGLIRRLLYAKKLHNERIFPVLLESADESHVPLELQGYDFFPLDGPSAYEGLLRKVLGRPLHQKPETGEPPNLEPQETAPLFPRPSGGPATESDAGPEKPLQPRWTNELPTYGDGFAGRERELEELDRAWDSGETRVFSLHAEGGAGKTRVLVQWLNGLRDAGWRGAGRVFVHSFYSQGSDERRNASSETFFEEALEYFGYRGEPITDPGEKGRTLAGLVVEQRGLLVLDGLEPLQHPPAFNEGRLKDPGIERLLLELSVATSGSKPALCVVTSRQPVVELRTREGRAVRQRELDRLDPAAGTDLLRQLEVRGPERELLEAADELDGHAYSVMLLGTYLRDATDDHEIRRRHEIPLLEEDEEHHSHARRMFQAYVQHLGEGSAEVALLRLLGFFDRAAERELLDVLRSPKAVIYERSEEAAKARQMGQRFAQLGMPTDKLPEVPKAEPKSIDDAMPAIIEPLMGLDTASWQRCLRRLQTLRLIAFEGGRFPIDSHALLREDFADRLRERFPEAWRSGHRRLYEHLCETTPHQPDTLEGLQPLYQAVSHGCQAGLHQKVLEEVYDNRILRGTGSGGHYSTKKLGAIGADLGAVACFFDRPWSRVSPKLSDADQAWMLNQAALRLRSLGRLTEAAEPMRATLEINAEAEQWKNAAVVAGNLSELELTLGEVSAAIEDAGQSVTFADRSGDEFLRMAERTAHADALHQGGRRDEARQLFEEAEAIQAERQPEYPRLYSLQGFRYCDLLLSEAERAAWRATLECGDWSPLWISGDMEAGSSVSAGREAKEIQSGDQSPHSKACDAVTERAEEWFEWRAESDSLLDIALDHLTLARAALYGQLCASAQIANQESEIENHLSAAVDGLRKAGTMDHFPRGLLTRAWHHGVTGDASGAAADLDEAWEIAERGPMPLYQADILLTRARLRIRGQGAETGSTDLQEARDELAEARRLIEEHGYHRRDGELEDAEAALRKWEAESIEMNTPTRKPQEPRSETATMQKTILELDLVGYSTICDNFEQGLDVTSITQLNEQIQGFIDAGLDAVNLARETTVNQTTGDGAILVFDSAPFAHQFAHAVHEATREHNKSRSQNLAKRVFRMGAATGEIDFTAKPGGGSDIAGTTIARAVRLESKAQPGGILIDEATYQGISDDQRAQYTDKIRVKGKRDEEFDAYPCQFYAEGPEQVSFFTEMDKSKHEDEPAPESTEEHLLEELKQLPAAWFDELVFKLDKGSAVPGKQAAQAQRAMDLIAVLRVTDPDFQKVRAQIDHLKGVGG